MPLPLSRRWHRSLRWEVVSISRGPLSPMMVSVILVTYNHERYIVQALDSVLSQEAPFEFEVLVSEDCSRDRTREIVLHYSRLYPHRIRLFLSERNLNTNEVTLRALRAARGTYV